MNTSGSTHADAGTEKLVDRMGEAASNFLASLAPDQRAKAMIDFSDEEKRTLWYYTPVDRDGLSMVEMDRPQQRLAHQLMATGVSRSGYVAASTIMGLENTLDYFELWQRLDLRRHPERYYVTIFGEPHAKEPWGWRFEGHHISLNFAIFDGRIVAPTPTFFGANPADAPLGTAARLRPLAGVEDLARDFVHALDGGHRASAILAAVAPQDIVMTNRPYVVEGALPIPGPEALQPWVQEHGYSAQEVERIRYSSGPQGVAAGALAPAQREILTALIGEYIRRMPDELAEIEFAKVQQRGLDGVHFAWAGGLQKGQPHYYRIQSDWFLVEYDNVQNDANHIHSVWRDPKNDFGADLLRQHHATGHRHSR